MQAEDRGADGGRVGVRRGHVGVLAALLGGARAVGAEGDVGAQRLGGARDALGRAGVRGRRGHQEACAEKGQCCGASVGVGHGRPTSRGERTARFRFGPAAIPKCRCRSMPSAARLALRAPWLCVPTSRSVCPCRGGVTSHPSSAPRRGRLIRVGHSYEVRCVGLQAPAAILPGPAGRGAAWQRACFGSRRSPVRIRAPRLGGRVFAQLLERVAAVHGRQRTLPSMIAITGAGGGVGGRVARAPAARGRPLRMSVRDAVRAPALGVELEHLARSRR